MTLFSLKWWFSPFLAGKEKQITQPRCKSSMVLQCVACRYPPTRSTQSLIQYNKAFVLYQNAFVVDNENARHSRVPYFRNKFPRKLFLSIIAWRGTVWEGRLFRREGVFFSNVVNSFLIQQNSDWIAAKLSLEVRVEFPGEFIKGGSYLFILVRIGGGGGGGSIKRGG